MIAVRVSESIAEKPALFFLADCLSSAGFVMVPISVFLGKKDGSKYSAATCFYYDKNQGEG
jgi:hypothetical protein